MTKIVLYYAGLSINKKILSGIYFTVDYDTNYYWQGEHFYGCRLLAGIVKNKLLQK